MEFDLTNIILNEKELIKIYKLIKELKYKKILYIGIQREGNPLLYRYPIKTNIMRNKKIFLEFFSNEKYVNYSEWAEKMIIIVEENSSLDNC